MTYTVSIATTETRDLIVTALRQAAIQRNRVAEKASREVAEDKRAGVDVRSSAVRVIGIVAEAADLNAVADQLATATDVPVVSVTPEPGPTIIVASTGSPAPLDDDGTSAEAQLAAARAGLTAADPTDLVEDPETAALPEDDPTADELADVDVPLEVTP